LQDFEIIGKITNIQIISVGNSIQVLERLIRDYGKGRWRKLKGEAHIRYFNGKVKYVELHWYEAHGLGKFDFKVKRKIR